MNTISPERPGHRRIVAKAGRWRVTFGMRVAAVPPTVAEAEAIAAAIVAELCRHRTAPSAV